MGRRGKVSVELRPSSMRLRFTWEGKARFPTIQTGGVPMAPTPANIRYAERLAAEVQERIHRGTFSFAEYFPASADATTGVGLDLGRQLDTWLAAQRIEASTRAGYTSAVRFWKGAVVDGTPLGERALSTLKHSDLLRALAARPSLSGKTVNNYVSVLREALDLAQKDGALQVNPADGIPRAAHQKDPPDPFSREEAEAIVAYMLAHYPEPVANYVEWWMFTGVRPSEAAGLRWASVDLASGYMQIREAIVRGVQKANTKTSVSRDVLLNSRALAALQRQRKHTQMAGAHVFLDPRYGTPWLEERAMRRSYWTPALKALGIRYRSPRHMRHTFATMMLMSGRTPAWCAGQMGHSVEMFLRTYSKWIRGAQDAQELQGFERWLAGPESAPNLTQRGN